MSLAETLNLILQALIWLAMLGAFYYAHKQLVLAKDATMGQNILSLITYLQAEDVRNARGTVMRELKDLDFSDWSEKQKHCAGLVCSTYDITAVLVKSGYVPKAPLVKDWGPSVRNCHKILKNYITHMQSEDMNGSDYWANFDWLNKESIKYKESS